MTTSFAVGFLTFTLIALSPSSSAPQNPQACLTGAACQCAASTTDVSANPFETCPCQRDEYCDPWIGSPTVPKDCCTTDPDDNETPCVDIVTEDPYLQHGCCKPANDPVCEIALNCTVKLNITVTISECCSATSDPGGIGTTGTIDCSGIKCCSGDEYTVSSGGSSNSWSGLGESTLFQPHAYMRCGLSDPGPTVFGQVKCSNSGSEYGDVAHISVSGFSCGQCPNDVGDN